MTADISNHGDWKNAQ